MSKLVLNGRLGELWSNEALDSIVNHRYPDDFFSHLILAKTLLTTQPSRVVERVCLWRILFFNRRTKVEFERSLISPSMSETIPYKNSLSETLFFASLFWVCVCVYWELQRWRAWLTFLSLYTGTPCSVIVSSYFFSVLVVCWFVFYRKLLQYHKLKWSRYNNTTNYCYFSNTL